MPDINYLLLLSQISQRSSSKCSNVDKLYSEVVKKHAARFKADSINVEPAELIELMQLVLICT